MIMHIPPSIYKPKSAANQAALVFAKAWSVAKARFGKNDIGVEVYRAGQWRETCLTDVHINEFFLIPNDESMEDSKCYVCKMPAKNAGGLDRHNPTLVLGVVEIGTAPVFQPRQKALPAPTNSNAKAKPLPLTFDEKGNLLE